MSRTTRRNRARKNLDTIQVAKPCSARWEDMVGDEKSRYCNHCRLNVFNLSAMELDEAANLIAEKEGHLCVRFYRRSDGSIITQDCPKGVELARRKLVAGWTAAVGLAAAIFGSAFGGMYSATKAIEHPTMGAPSSAPLMGDIAAPLDVQPIPVDDPPLIRPEAIMGARAVPQSGTEVKGQPTFTTTQGYVSAPRADEGKLRMRGLGESTNWKPDSATSNIEGDKR